MRLLTITHYSDLLGANRSLLHLLEGLRAKGVVIEVWCPHEGAFTAALRQKQFAYKILPFANWGYTLRSVGLWLFPFKWLKNSLKMPFFEQEMRQFQPDILHSNSSLVSLGAMLAERTGVPHVWHIREFGWADYQVIFPLGRRFTQKYHAQAAAFIAISDCIRRRVLPHIGAKPPVFTIFNGVGQAATLAEMSRNAPLKPAAHSTETDTTNLKICRFLIIGLLHPSKNQLQALRAFRLAFAENPNLRLDIVGAGRRIYTLRLKWLCRVWGLAQAVKFWGYTPQPDAAYANADVVLMCSGNEGMGRVTAEAMARNKPVIGCNSGATPEIIIPDENGLLYDGTDADLSRKMLFLAKNPRICTEIGAKAHQTVLARFTDEQYAAACFEVFEKVGIRD